MIIKLEQPRGIDIRVSLTSEEFPCGTHNKRELKDRRRIVYHELSLNNLITSLNNPFTLDLSYS